MSSSLLKILFVGLLFHLFLLGILYYFGMPGFILSIIRFWKEILIIILFVTAVFFKRSTSEIHSITRYDYIVVAFVTLCVIYFLFFSTNAELFVSKVDEIRVYLYVCVIFWIGRSLMVGETEILSIIRMFSVFVLISACIGILNNLFFGHGLIYFADNYSSKLSAGSEFTQVVTTEDFINAVYTPYMQIRNLNGSYLSLGNTLLFANMFFLGSHYFQRKKKDFYCFLAGSFFLIFTGARAATAVSILLSLCIVTFFYKKPKITLGLSMVFVVFFISIPGLAEKFSDTLGDLANVDSPLGHMGGWYAFLDAFSSEPFGYGFGVGERSAATFGTSQLIGGESNFSHVFGNVGIIGGLLWLGMVYYSWSRSIRVLRLTDRSTVAILAFTTFFVSVGYFLIAFTQYLNDNYEASLPLWFLIGWISFQSYRADLVHHRSVDPKIGNGVIT